MIGNTLNFIASQLNNVVCQRLQLNPSNPKVILSNIVDHNGTINVKDKNVLLLKLINIEQEPIANNSVSITREAVNFEMKSPPLYINLQLVLAAYYNPEQVQSGLDTLTIGLSFIHGKPSWNAQNTPGLPSGIKRLVFEMETLDFHQLNQVWGAIGTNYMPSVMYKIRMLTIDDGAIQGLVEPVKEVG
jgi:hypothetical protein